MQIAAGMIVRSLAGHDAERFYVVLAVQGANALIADGKRRKLRKPKVKNLRHLAPTRTVLTLSQLTTDAKIRRALWPFNYGGEDPVME